ncbi:MAG: hypothetical protein ACKVOU_07070 [Cytophagales bacterium]
MVQIDTEILFTSPEIVQIDTEILFISPEMVEIDTEILFISPALAAAFTCKPVRSLVKRPTKGKIPKPDK